MDEEEKRLDVIREVHRLNAIKEAEKVNLTLYVNFLSHRIFSLVSHFFGFPNFRIKRDKAKLKNLKIRFAPQ